MVDVGKLNDESWPEPEPEPEVEPVTIGQLRDATSDVTAGFAALAETMRPDGNLIDTSRRAYELGDKLRDFGRLHERYWSQVLGSLGISDEPRGR